MCLIGIHAIISEHEIELLPWSNLFRPVNSNPISYCPCCFSSWIQTSQKVLRISSVSHKIQNEKHSPKHNKTAKKHIDAVKKGWDQKQHEACESNRKITRAPLANFIIMHGSHADKCRIATLILSNCDGPSNQLGLIDSVQKVARLTWEQITKEICLTRYLLLVSLSSYTSALLVCMSFY